MSSRTLITGGSGFLGTHLRRIFNGDDLSRRSGLDILSADDVALVAEYDVVIHLAARLDKSPDSAEEVFRTNVEGTVNVLKHVRPDAVFIFASTKDVYGRFADNFAQVPEDCPTLYSGQSPLEWSKLIAERYVEYYAHRKRFKSCIFRMSTIVASNSEGNVPNFVGNFADAINQGVPLILPGSGRAIRDLLYVDDLADACQAFVDSVIRHGLYNIGGGLSNALSINEMVEKLEEVSGLQAVLSEDRSAPEPVPNRYVTDLDRVSQELGWAPKTRLEEAFKTLF
ncbi:MAG: NAD-dependent epimerase/dehydratase family protein [Acidobacteriota bacterium]